MGRILGSIGDEGRVEEMCEAAGLVPGERRFARFDVEMGPEVEDLVRASVSPGAIYIAVKERVSTVVSPSTPSLRWRHQAEMVWPNRTYERGSGVALLVAYLSGRFRS